MHRNIKLLALHEFFTDFQLYSALLILYFQKVTGSYTAAMSLFSVVMISSAIFELPTGVFSDYLGRRKTVIAGALCATLATTFYALGMNYWILFLGAVFEGLQRAWYSGNNNALLYETLAAEHKAHDYDIYAGKVGSMVQFSIAIAVVLGGIFAEKSFALVMWISVIPQIICIFIAFLLVEPAKVHKERANIYTHIVESFTKIWNNSKLRLLSLSSILSFAIGESAYQFRSAFISTLWPLWAIGFSKVLSSLGAGIGYWFSGTVIRKVGPFRMLLLTDLYYKFADFTAIISATVFSPVLLSSTSLFYGINQVARNKLMQDEFTDDQRATLGSITSFIGNFAFGIAAVALGYCGDVFGPRIALLIAYGCTVPNIWIKWHLFKTHERS